MQSTMAGDIWTYLQDTEGRIYRFWVYRRMFTPYEQQKGFIDESVFEDTMASMGTIKDCIALPDGDLLLGFQRIYEDLEWSEHIEYYKLSEIRMEYWADDQKVSSDSEDADHDA